MLPEKNLEFAWAKHLREDLNSLDKVSKSLSREFFGVSYELKPNEMNGIFRYLPLSRT